MCCYCPLICERVQAKSLEILVQNWSKTWRYLVSDSQLRWLGPEKGVMHLALGVVVNALWDLWARVLGKPVWNA